MVPLNRGGTYASVSPCTRSTDDVEVDMIDCPLEVDCDDEIDRRCWTLAGDEYHST